MKEITVKLNLDTSELRGFLERAQEEALQEIQRYLDDALRYVLHPKDNPKKTQPWADQVVQYCFDTASKVDRVAIVVPRTIGRAWEIVEASLLASYRACNYDPLNQGIELMPHIRQIRILSTRIEVFSSYLPETIRGRHHDKAWYLGHLDEALFILESGLAFKGGQLVRTDQ